MRSRQVAFILSSTYVLNSFFLLLILISNDPFSFIFHNYLFVYNEVCNATGEDEGNGSSPPFGDWVEKHVNS